MTQPGIPNDYTLSTSCYGSRLRTIEDQAFAAVAMGFRRLEIGLSDQPIPLNGFEESQKETGITVRSIMAGCLNPRSEHEPGTRLGSLDEDRRERALNSARRHARLALRYGCPTVVLRGCVVENDELRRASDALHARLLNEGPSEELSHEVAAFVQTVQKKGQRQLDHLCRSIHTLLTEFPEVRLAIEPGSDFHDLLSYEAVGWALEDLGKKGLGYWHDTGRIQVRARAGLPPQGKWLDTYGKHALGVHLQDAAENEAQMPPGTGEVDFKLVASYLPAEAERVLEIHSRHGRAEILAAVQFLVDQGI